MPFPNWLWLQICPIAAPLLRLLRVRSDLAVYFLRRKERKRRNKSSQDKKRKLRQEVTFEPGKMLIVGRTYCIETMSKMNVYNNVLIYFLTFSMKIFQNGIQIFALIYHKYHPRICNNTSENVAMSNFQAIYFILPL